MAAEPSKGPRICIFVDYSFEDMEVMYPKMRLEEAGARVSVVGAHPAGNKYTGKFGYPIKSDMCVDDVSAVDFDGLVLPGGFAPDYMRRNARMLEVIVDMLDADKPVAAICHGPWMLCSARRPDGKPVLSGVRCTSFVAIKDDVVNAGGVWVDEAVVRDKNIITSRTPEDLSVWCAAILQAATTAAAAQPCPFAKNHTVVIGAVEGENRGEDPMKPPVCKIDPYYWMRDDDRKDPNVIAHLESENSYTKAQTAHLSEASDRMYAEMLSHVQETDDSVPYPSGSWLYYSRTVEGLSYRIHCRRSILSIEGEEQIVLDENKLAEGLSHCDVGCIRPSPDHNLVAYTLDDNGSETYKLHVLDLSTGAEVATGLESVEMDSCVQWGGDNSSVFYCTLDHAHRPHKAWRHSLAGPEAPECLFTEDNELFWMGLHKFRSGTHMCIETASSETSECFLVALDAPAAAPVVVEPRSFGVRYDVVDIVGGLLYVVTNADGAKNQKLVCTDASACSRQNWRDVRPYDSELYITGCDCFATHIVIEGRQGGFSQLWVASVSDPSSWRRLEFEDPICTVECGTNKMFDASVLRIQYSSLTTPASVLEYDFNSTEITLLKEKPVPHFDRSKYLSERVSAVARDGVEVPMSMVYNKELRDQSKPAPVLLYGYGSYGICIDPEFNASLLPLLDRGVIFISAQIRGGSEQGRATWYEEQGKYLTKRNTFNDFCDCAQHLVDSGISSPDKLAISGRSAGGLLMGAVLNMRPDLFRVAIAGVPFVDVLTTMSDASIPLTVGEWEEWGNPNEEKYFDYIRGYSPYDNVTAQDYPSILVTAGLHDPRVAYWEPAKWVALLRDRKTDSNPLLFKCDLSSGHFSASDRYKHLKERAFEYTFMLDQLGLLS